MSIILFPLFGYCDGTRTIRVEYEYSDSANVDYYRLFKDGELVCEDTGPDTMYMDCDVFLTQAPMAFTLTAVDFQGVESPPSNIYTMSLSVEDEYGNYEPVISLQADMVSGLAPLTVTFDASQSSDVDGTITEYQWDFADGAVGSGEVVTHIFDTPGLFEVALTITDNSGAVTSTTKLITVTEDPASSSNQLPTAVILASPVGDGVSAVSVSFDALDSSDPDGMIQTYSWDFGDGSTGTGATIVHDYVIAGEYTVTLNVIDDEGGFAFDQMVVVIVDDPSTANTPPVSIITASVSERQVHFEWDYTPTNTAPVGFRLYQNDNVVCEVTDPTARQMDCPVFVEVGLVKLYLTAYDQNQVETSISNVFTFDSTGIVPSTHTGSAPFTVHFNGSLSYDPDGTILSSQWEFGEGTSAIGATAQHTYTIDGVYTVTHTVTDNIGAVVQATTTINILTANAKPVAQNSVITLSQDSRVEGFLSASDADSSELQYRIISNSSLGKVVITDPTSGRFKYTPKGTDTGIDTFTFVANDGISDSNIATITITVAPVDAIRINDVSASPSMEVVSSASSVSPHAAAVETTNNNENPTDSSVSEGISNSSVATPSATNSANDDSSGLASTTVNQDEVKSGTGSIQPPVDATHTNDVSVGKVPVRKNKPEKIHPSRTDTRSDGQILKLLRVKSAANGRIGIKGVDIPHIKVPGSVGQKQERYTVAWDYKGKKALSGFRLYVNGVAICETKYPAVRQFTCHVDSIDGNIEFHLKSLDLKGEERDLSNTVIYSP